MDSIDEIIGDFNRVKSQSTVKYLDWEKAKRLCTKYSNCSIYAGIKEDMGNTSGKIFDKGKFCKEYVYDRSWWGTPILEVWNEELDMDLEIPCWTIEPHEESGVPYWWTGLNIKDV